MKTGVTLDVKPPAVSHAKSTPNRTVKGSPKNHPVYEIDDDGSDDGSESLGSMEDYASDSEEDMKMTANDNRRETAAENSEITGKLAKYKEYYNTITSGDNYTHDDKVFVMTQLYSHAYRFIRKGNIKFATLRKLEEWLIKKGDNHLSAEEAYGLTHTTYQERHPLTAFLDPKTKSA
jgi:hypothetical protein